MCRFNGCYHGRYIPPCLCLNKMYTCAYIYVGVCMYARGASRQRTYGI